jgi:hypothetical protein
MAKPITQTTLLLIETKASDPNAGWIGSILFLHEIKEEDLGSIGGEDQLFGRT